VSVALANAKMIWKSNSSNFDRPLTTSFRYLVLQKVERKKENAKWEGNRHLIRTCLHFKKNENECYAIVLLPESNWIKAIQFQYRYLISLIVACFLFLMTCYQIITDRESQHSVINYYIFVVGKRITNVRQNDLQQFFNKHQTTIVI